MLGVLIGSHELLSIAYFITIDQIFADLRRTFNTSDVSVLKPKPAQRRSSSAMKSAVTSPTTSIEQRASDVFAGRTKENVPSSNTDEYSAVDEKAAEQESELSLRQRPRRQHTGPGSKSTQALSSDYSRKDL